MLHEKCKNFINSDISIFQHFENGSALNQAFERSNNIQWKNTDNENYTTYEYS